MDGSRIDISVVVPVFNVERYLSEALDSLLAQTISPKRMEIICVDDGSTDGCPDILRAYETRRAQEAGRILRVMTLRENRGYGHAMNTGFAAANGEFVGILEADDFTEPDMFASLLSIAREHDADVVKSNFYARESDPGVDHFVEHLQGHDYGIALNVDTDPAIALLQPSIWSAIYRRDFLERNNIRFNETPGAAFQDAAFAFQVYCCAKRLVLTPEAYVHYRIDNPDSSIHSKEKEFAIYEEIAAIEAFVNANATRRAKLSPLALYREFWMHQWNLARISNPEAAATASKMMSAHLQRAQTEGRIDIDLFTTREKADLIRLLHYRPDH